MWGLQTLGCEVVHSRDGPWRRRQPSRLQRTGNPSQSEGVRAYAHYEDTVLRVTAVFSGCFHTQTPQLATTSTTYIAKENCALPPLTDITL